MTIAAREAYHSSFLSWTIVSFFPDARSHWLTKPSLLAAASRLPSGEKASDNTSPLSFLSVRSAAPVVASQSRMWESSIAVAMLLPSGENTTA